MKILLVNPKNTDNPQTDTGMMRLIGKKALEPPLGLLTVAAILPKEWEKGLVDVVVRDLTDSDIRWADYVFLGGMDKGEFLKTFGADFFFDDQNGHCESARRHVPTGHVPHGVVNEGKSAG